MAKKEPFDYSKATHGFVVRCVHGQAMAACVDDGLPDIGEMIVDGFRRGRTVERVTIEVLRGTGIRRCEVCHPPVKATPL